uniref:PEP-CTERM protein-sorting domain-containing protein n=1 Tax=Tanacetum cinerariifolium TaxID=118510 RepID=A0A699GFH2_TANCI|nr:hypothetical protein [Tanacetum cinerariifolium]
MFKRLSAGLVATLLLCTATVQAADYKYTFTATDFSYGGFPGEILPPVEVVTGSFEFSAAELSGQWANIRGIDVVIGSRRYGMNETSVLSGADFVIISGKNGGFGAASPGENDFVFHAQYPSWSYLEYSEIQSPVWWAGAITTSISDITAVPEPETYAFLLAGLGLIGAVSRRRKAGEKSAFSCGQLACACRKTAPACGAVWSSIPGLDPGLGWRIGEDQRHQDTGRRQHCANFGAMTLAGQARGTSPTSASDIACKDRILRGKACFMSIYTALSLFKDLQSLASLTRQCQDSAMTNIYRSQFRLPFSLFEKLKAEAGRAGRSVNAELVGRLERSLTDSSNDLDVRIIFEALERLSLRNPELRYSFGVNLGNQLDVRPAEIGRGSWTLAADPGNPVTEILLKKSADANSNPSRKTQHATLIARCGAAGQQYRPAHHHHHPVLHVGLADGVERRADSPPEVDLHAHVRAGDAGADVLFRRLLYRLAAGRHADQEDRLPARRRCRAHHCGGRLRAVLSGVHQRLRAVPPGVLHPGHRHYDLAGGRQSVRDGAGRPADGVEPTHAHASFQLAGYHHGARAGRHADPGRRRAERAGTGGAAGRPRGRVLRRSGGCRAGTVPGAGRRAGGAGRAVCAGASAPHRAGRGRASGGGRLEGGAQAAPPGAGRSGDFPVRGRGSGHRQLPHQLHRRAAYHGLARAPGRALRELLLGRLHAGALHRLCGDASRQPGQDAGLQFDGGAGADAVRDLRPRPRSHVGIAGRGTVQLHHVPHHLLDGAQQARSLDGAGLRPAVHGDRGRRAGAVRPGLPGRPLQPANVVCRAGRVLPVRAVLRLEICGDEAIEDLLAVLIEHAHVAHQVVDAVDVRNQQGVHGKAADVFLAAQHEFGVAPVLLRAPARRWLPAGPRCGRSSLLPCRRRTAAQCRLPAPARETPALPPRLHARCRPPWSVPGGRRDCVPVQIESSLLILAATVVEIRVHVAGLRLYQAVVRAFPGHQFIVAAFFHHHAAIHHHQAVRFCQRGQAVGNGNRRAALDQVFQRALDFLFRLGIDGSSRLVEDQDLRIDQQRARNRDALAFAARQALAPFTDHRIVTLRQAQDEFVRVGGAGGRDDFFARRIRFAVRQIFRDGAEEQERLLQHQADLPAVVGYGQRADVHPVEHDGAFGHVVEAADQVDQRRFAGTGVTDQAHHFAGLDVEVDAAVDGAVTVPEAHFAQRDIAFHFRQLDRVDRVGHGRYMVENVEDALGGRCRFLRDRDDAAHGIEAAVETARIRNERRQHTDRDIALRDLEDAEHPDHQQAQFGQERHGGREQRPDFIELVVDGQIVLVGGAEARRFARLLRKRFDHADAGDGIGQHVGHFAPHAVDFFKARAQAVAHQVDQPRDERQRRQREDGQIRIDREQDHARHDDHQAVRREVQQVQRQEHANAVALAADARHQVARALAAEVFERQAQQVVVRLGAQVGANALGHQRQHIRLGPAENPRQHRRAHQAGHVQHDQAGIDRRAVLVRDQHLVHQRDGQIRRNHVRARGQQHQHEAQAQLQFIRTGKAPQAEQGPGGRRRVHHLGAHGAFFLVRFQRRLAAGADIGVVADDGHAAGVAVALGGKVLDQADRLQILAQRKAPGAQPAARAHQFQVAHARMIVVCQRQLRRERPCLPLLLAGRARQQAAAGDHQHTLGETKLLIQVNLQGTYNVFPLGKLCLYIGTPAVRQFAARARYCGKLLGCHCVAYSGSGKIAWCSVEGWYVAAAGQDFNRAMRLVKMLNYGILSFITLTEVKSVRMDLCWRQV